MSKYPPAKPGKAGGLNLTWFGYTQTSFRLVANRRFSSPFREANYEPEAMLIWPLQLSTGDFRMRFVGLTLNHQANGRSGALHRLRQ
jgi:phospholipase A1/A2